MTATSWAPPTAAWRARGSFLGCWTLSACLAVACGSPEHERQQHLERAQAASTRGAHAAAAIEYRNVLQSDPNHAAAHCGLALSLLELAQGEDAAWELRECIRLDPENLDARVRFAWLALAADSPDETLEQAEAILARSPDHLEAKHVRIAALLAKEDFERAAAESEAILARSPQDRRAHYHLARARAAQGRLDEAERNLLRFRELEGASPAATREVVSFYRSTDQNAKAVSTLKTAVRESAAPDRAGFALELADLLAQQGRPNDAEEALTLALAAAPERLDVRERLARLQAGDGRLDSALRLVEEAAASRPPDAQIGRIAGDLLIAGGRFDEALARYRAGLRLAPDSGELRLREAEALLRAGQLEAASARIGALLEQHPEDPLVALTQVRTLALAARTDDAIEVLRGLLARDPELVQAHFLLGVLRLAMSRPEQAVEPLELAAARLTGPAARAAHGLLAEAQLRAGNFEAAVRSAERALADDPQDQHARIVLAGAFQGSGANERAEAVLDEASGVSPALHSARARLFVRTGRLADAEREVERALALEPDSVQWVVDLVWVLLEQGKTTAALDLARTRSLEHPAVPDYPNLVGQIALRQDDPASAQRAFRKAIEVDASFVPGYVNLARIAARARRYAEAVDLLQRALVQRPGDAEALRELGAIESERANPAAAVAALEAALRADPTSDATRAQLARAQAQAGRDLPSALEVAREIRRSDPKNPVYADTLGQVMVRSGLHAAAAEQFRAAIELAPHPIAAYHYRLGLALESSGNLTGARREFERALEVDGDFAEADDARKRARALRESG